MLRFWLDRREELNRAIDDIYIGFAKGVIHGLSSVGENFIFFLKSFRSAFRRPMRIEEIIKHLEFIGNKSILIICLTGLFTGMALSYQIYLGFNLVNATNLVGPTVALGISRELGPVLTGLIVAARAGGAMAARLGTMRVSEQIDAMEVMGVEPVHFLVGPRILAAFIALPLLCGVFDFIAMAGSWFLCVPVLGLDEAIFWDKIALWLNPRDINEGLIKSAAFGLTFGAICTHRGFHCSGGAKGVGEATNSGVVHSMVLIIIMNFFMTNIIRFFDKLIEGGY
jgi:phospholipid/cholesterol/gamma-HCH transport system permease protein